MSAEREVGIEGSPQPGVLKCELSVEESPRSERGYVACKASLSIVVRVQIGPSDMFVHPGLDVLGEIYRPFLGEEYAFSSGALGSLHEACRCLVGKHHAQKPLALPHGGFLFLLRKVCDLWRSPVVHFTHGFEVPAE